ncbi:hypothetical protein CGC20_36740 [Leishmania donovani]|uniref:Uncharacterized protein n=1 Tax=Leishmania donovani TaxID=5661 RepID=A0A504X7J0_LEIDO|nr:hypothetical protein CGC20_36740 [Leishmania donovani]
MLSLRPSARRLQLHSYPTPPRLPYQIIYPSSICVIAQTLADCHACALQSTGSHIVVPSSESPSAPPLLDLLDRLLPPTATVEPTSPAAPFSVSRPEITTAVSSTSTSRAAAVKSLTSEEELIFGTKSHGLQASAVMVPHVAHRYQPVPFSHGPSYLAATAIHDASSVRETAVVNRVQTFRRLKRASAHAAGYFSTHLVLLERSEA